MKCNHCDGEHKCMINSVPYCHAHSLQHLQIATEGVQDEIRVLHGKLQRVAQWYGAVVTCKNDAKLWDIYI